MKKLLIGFLSYFLFWLVVFLFSKVIFLVVNLNLTFELTMPEIMLIFLNGLKLDLSMVGYMMVIPGIVLSVSFLLNQKLFSAIFKFYTLVLLVIASFINIIDLALYPYWGARVSVTVFYYMDDPKGVFSNVSLVQAFGAFAVFMFFILLFYWIYIRFIEKYLKKVTELSWQLLVVMLIVSGLLIIPIRGGLGHEPLKLSKVSFSEKVYVNHSAYNFMWYFFYTVIESVFQKNPCNYLNQEEAGEILRNAENQRIASNSIVVDFNTDSVPNVLLIILESFSNKTITALGGNYNVCPNIDSICDDAVVFPSFYASGNRSDKGIGAILGSYPSLLSNSVTNYPEKYEKLTPLAEYFNNRGYISKFYYGGNIEFYNLKTLVTYSNFKNIVSMNDFSPELQKMSNWGVPDGYLFDRVLNEMSGKKPFFTTVYTISSHPPFDVPYRKIQGKTIDDKYLNSVAYTDSCLGSFIRKLKQSVYWNNTLVIITSDHGALQPGPTEIIEPATFRIPLIWTGGLVKNHVRIEKVGSQTDLAPTLIRQLGWEPAIYKFSRDLFSTPSYAFYMCDTGWGYVTENDGKWFYDRNSGKFLSFSKENKSHHDFNFAKAFLQVLHDDFLK